MIFSIKKTSLIVQLMAIIAAAILYSCGGASYPVCITPNLQEVKIKWGTAILSTGEKKAFEIDAMARVYEVTRGPGQKDEIKKEIGKIPENKYCKIFEMLNAEILKTQTLNSALDTARFVEYYNPRFNSVVRGMWNPKFDTFGSAGYREIFDSLQSALNIIQK